MMGKSFKMLINRGFDPIGGGGTQSLVSEFLTCKRNEKCYNSDMIHHYKEKLSAFTLAEVLITLGIIGVVAAITIPTLLSKYQMKVFETAFKKQYSVLQNAINYSVQVEGISECYIYFEADSGRYTDINSDCNTFRKSLISLLQLQPYDKQHDTEYKFKSRDEVLAEGGKTVNEHCNYDNSVNSQVSYFTKDGAILIFSNVSNTANPIITIDVNGKKGPNKWGYDVFFMTLSNHNQNNPQDQKILLTDEFCSLTEKGGRLPRTILTNKEITEDGDLGWFWN